MKTIFKESGFFLEYMIDGKFIGTTLIDKPDREEVGYYGRINAVATEDLKIGKKIIKKGTNYYTRMYPLCGKKK
tara:strand:+ start:2533 stop:2754 length:222 start_codon:yes stop_codon:yes gene_type:complete